MTRTAKQILKILIDLGIGQPEWVLRIRRTYAGYWQLARGSWKWWADRKLDGEPDWWEVCGSCDTCKDIIEAHKADDKYVSIEHGPGGRELFAEKKALK